MARFTSRRDSDVKSKANKDKDQDPKQAGEEAETFDPLHVPAVEELLDLVRSLGAGKDLLGEAEFAAVKEKYDALQDVEKHAAQSALAAAGHAALDAGLKKGDYAEYKTQVEAGKEKKSEKEKEKEQEKAAAKPDAPAAPAA